MAVQALVETYLTPEEYLAMERQAETKSEYFNGGVYAIPSANVWHATIMVNIVAYLGVKFKGRPCVAFTSDMRIKVSATGLYTYPDAVVICGKAKLEDREQDTLLNPTVIFEIFSPSTEGYDRGAKFAHYQTLESLTDYVLISQTEAKVEHFARQPGGKWLLSVYKGLEAVTLLPSIGCDLPLAEVYDKVEFPAPGTIPLRIVRERQSEYEFEDDAYARRLVYSENDC